MKGLTLILLTLFCNSCTSKTCFEGICLPKNYSQTTRPLLTETNNVTIDFNIIRTLDIDDIKCTFELYLYINLKWKDPRIESTINITNSIALNSALTDLLWKPDLFTLNQKLYKEKTLLNERPPGSVWMNNDKDLGLIQSIYEAEGNVQVRKDFLTLISSL